MVHQAPDAAGSAVTTGSSLNVVIVGVLAVLSNLGITSWAEAAGVLACVLTLTHLFILWWKIMWRPLFVYMGVLRRSRRASDARPQR